MAKIKYVTSQDCKDILNACEEIDEHCIVYGEPGAYFQKTFTIDLKTYKIIDVKIDALPPDALLTK